MKVLPIALSTVVFASCATDKADPASEAVAAFDKYVAAINEGDTKSIEKLYDDNLGFHWVERGGVAYESGVEAAASFGKLINRGTDISMTINDTEVAALSDTSALLSTRFEIELTQEGSDQTFAFDGWMTVGMAKRKDGWKISGGQTGPGEDAE